MADLIALFAVAGILAVVLAAIALGSRHRIWVKIGALVTVALFLPTIYVSLAALLSRAKPVGIEWAQRNAPSATVLGAHLQEGKAIYVWLMLAGEHEPRAYVLPWNKEQAKQLHKARREARKKGRKAMMRLPFRKNREDGAKMFYAPPQPPLPVKREAMQRGN